MSESELSTSALYSAFPTVRVDGRESETVSRHLLALTMTEQEGGMSALEMRLSNFGQTSSGTGLLFEDERDVKLGSELAVYAGDEAGPREIFRGLVTGLEAEFPQGEPPELVILAEDRLQLARLARRSRLHENLTLASLAERVATSLSLTPRVTGLSANIGTHAQLNESDLAFLRRLLFRYDGDLQVVGTELHVSPRNDVDRGELELRLHGSGQLRRVRLTADLAHQVTATTTGGWDEAQGQRTRGTSSGAHPGPGTGRTGATLLRQALGERSEHVSHLAVTTDREARALADAAFDQRARRFVTANGTTSGNPRLRVGTRVRLADVSQRFDNVYYVVRALHRFDMRSGYLTEFEAESAFLGNP